MFFVLCLFTGLTGQKQKVFVMRFVCVLLIGVPSYRRTNGAQLHATSLPTLEADCGTQHGTSWGSPLHHASVAQQTKLRRKLYKVTELAQQAWTKEASFTLARMLYLACTKTYSFKLPFL